MRKKFTFFACCLVVLAILLTGCTGNPPSTTTLTTTSLPTTPTPKENITGQPVQMPSAHYDLTTDFIPSGWMGDTGSIKLDTNYKINPHSGDASMQVKYSPEGSNGWAGIYWQYPEKNWGDLVDGKDLRNYSKVTFWACGENGGEKAEFKVGGIDGKAAYPDSIQPAKSTGVITLTKDWKQYTIDLNGKNLSHVIGGFCWVTDKTSNPKGATIYLDDLWFEN